MKRFSPASAPLPMMLTQFSIVNFLFGFAALQLPRQAGNLATIWFAGAIATAVLVHANRKRMLALLACAALANLGAHLSCGDALLPALCFALIHALEAALAAVLLRRTGLFEQFDDSPERYLRMLIIGASVAPLAGATLGALLLAQQQGAPFALSWLIWYASSATGAIATLPVALHAVAPARPDTAPIAWRQTVLAGAATVAIVVGALSWLPFPFLAILALPMLAALRLPFAGVAIIVWLATATTGAMIAAGRVMAFNALNIWHLPMVYVPMMLTMLPPMALAASVRQGALRAAARQQFEEALDRSRQQLQTIIDHIPAMVGYWDKDLHNCFGNRAYKDWFGVSPDEMRGKHIRTIIGEKRYELNLPYFEAVLRGESPLFERLVIDQTGTTRNTLVSYIPEIHGGAVTGFYAFVTDITAVKRAQREQFEAQSQLQGIIDSASEFAIIAVRTDGMIRVFNVGAERMLGYRADELVGRQTPGILLDRNEILARGIELSAQMGHRVEGFDIFVGKAKLGQADRQEWTFIRKDGSRLAVGLVVTAIRNADGEITGYLGIANDITEQKLLQKSLTTAKEEAEAASGAKSQFVANMSHEIRTPLNAVLGMTHLLANTPLSPDQEKYLDMIRISGQALLSVLNDILDFSKIEAGRMELAPELFQLGDMLGSLATIMAVNAGGKDLELAIGIDPVVPAVLHGDAQRLQQVLINLTHNAIKFTEHGEVSLWIDLDDSRAQTQEDQVWLRFCVRDSGIGMDEAQQTRLFSPFSQVDSSMTRRFGGTGLGLTISRRLVDMMNGTIAVRSTLGTGSEFTVTVPLTAAARLTPQDNDARRALRVLVVDDNPTSLRYLSRTLQAWTAHVETAASRAEALACIEAACAAGAGHDLVLLDWNLDDMQSAQLVTALRRARGPADMAIVVMVNAFQRARLIEEESAALADTILIKPVTGPSLHDIFHDTLVARANRRDENTRPHVPAAPRRLEGATLLLVEDNYFNQIVAQSMLEHAGATVDLVDNGSKALERLRARPQAYDLVLMDVQMPVMDGFAATRAIRSELGLDLPVLAMTAGVLPSEREQCMASGMNGFIAKPIHPEQMFSTIIQYLPLRRPARTMSATLGVPDSGFLSTFPSTSAVPPMSEYSPHAQPSEPAPSVPPIPPAEQVFNADPLLMATQDDPVSRKKILELIASAIERAPLQMAEARTAWKEGRHADAAKVFHTLRGSIGTLGARQFASSSVAVESAILADGGAPVAPLFEAAERDLAATLEQARRWLDEYDATAGEDDAA